VVLEIGDDTIVVEQGVVDIEEKDRAIHGATLPRLAERGKPGLSASR
jgi:hypothetical protein